MANTRLVSAIVAAGVVAAGVSAGAAWAGGPGGYVDDTADDISAAVGTGEFDGALVGFTATGDTNAEASAAVVAACEAAGGVECTSDEVTNDNLCIVSVAASDGSGVVAGGAGATVEAARGDAFNRAAANNTPLDPGAQVVVSACP